MTALVEHVPPQPENSAGFTAMVVDDHPLVRESMVARLTAMGAREIVEAASCRRSSGAGPRQRPS